MSVEFAKAALQADAMSEEAVTKLFAIPSINLGALWAILVGYVNKIGGWKVVFQVLENVILKLPLGSPWSELIAVLIAELNKLLLSTQTTP